MLKTVIKIILVYTALTGSLPSAYSANHKKARFREAVSFAPATPVARPYDNFIISGPKCPFGGKAKADIINELLPFNLSGHKGITWKVSTKSGKNIDGNSWAAWKFRIPDVYAQNISGIRIEAEASRATKIWNRVYCGVSEQSPFKRGKPVTGYRIKNLKPGKNTISIYWKDYKHAAKTGKNINGISLAVKKMPFELKVNRIFYLFKDKESLDKCKKEQQAIQRKRLITMLKWLAARGIDIRNQINAAPLNEVKEMAWTGVDLLAMREQIEVWGNLLNYNKISNNSPELTEAWKQAKTKLEEGKLNLYHKAADALRLKVDSLVNVGLQRIPPEKRRFYYDEKDKRFHRPDGRPYRVFAPHFFRSMYSPDKFVPEMLWQPWDLRYLAGMGFNGLRLQIKWIRLEPEQGRFNVQYIKMLQDIIREAERYGLGVDIDFHWGWPDWFRKGKPGYSAMKSGSKSNLYHWPEPVFTAWEKLGQELAGMPNVVAFEVPGNETPIGKATNGIKSYPYLIHLWNQWLKSTYKTRNNLATAWSSSSKYSARYTLKKHEDFDNDSVEPLGFQGDNSPEEAYAYNPRVYDHLRWTAWMQRYFSTEIIKIIRKHRPGAVGMFQRTIGDKWDKSPVPLNYMYIQTCVGPGTFPGTHYQMGSIQAMAAATQSLASFDSEQQMENNSKAVTAQVKLGLGFCPFAFHKRGGGGMLFVDDDWYLKDSVTHLPEKAAWIKSYWPKSTAGKKRIALIVNSKLAATTGDITLKLPNIIRDSFPGYKLEVYESMRVEYEPEMLNGCLAVITSSDYLSPVLLNILVNKYKGKVLLAGRLDYDVQVKKLGEQLVKNKLFIKNSNIDKYSPETCGIIDLQGSWKWFFAGKNINPEKLPSKNSKWGWMKVPGNWGETGITGSLEYAIGFGWYWKQVEVPESWKNRKLYIRFGAIDDFDWTYINGKLIGHIGNNVRNYWMQPRIYSIPKENVNWGGRNDIMICVENNAMDASISSPAEIFALQTMTLKWLNGKAKGKTYSFTVAVNSPRIPISQLRPNVKIIAELLDDKDEKIAAFIKQNRFWWWIGRRDWNRPLGQAVLKQFIESSQQ